MDGRIQVEIIVFSLSFCLFFSACNQNTKKSENYIYSCDSIKEGDIILRKSFGLVSEIIVVQLHDTINVSHCGIIVVDSNHHFEVIHSLSKRVSNVDGVQSCSLDDFMSDSQFKTVKIVRYRKDSLWKIATKAKECLHRKIPFDEAFNSQDTTSLFCSELPIHIIKNVYKVDVSEGALKPKFSVFLNPKYFTEIPFIYKDLSE